MGTAIAAAKPMTGRAGTVPVNFAWSSAGNAVYSACQWGMVAVLAKLGSAEMVGRYALGLAVAAPVLMLAQMNLRAVLATDIGGDYEFRDYLGLRARMLAAAMAAIAVLAWMEGGSGETAWAIALVGLAQAVEAMSDIHHGLWQQQERMDGIAASLAARGVLSVAALGGAVALTGSLPIGLVAMLGARLAVLGLYDVRTSRGVGKGRQEPARVPARQAEACATGVRQAEACSTGGRGALLWAALPLGVVLMLNALMGNVPRYFIAHHLGEGALGVFLAVATLAATGNMVVNALGQAATPRLARLYAEGELAGFRGLSLRLVAAGAALGLAGLAASMLWGEPLLRLIYRYEYAAHHVVLDEMMLAAGAGYVASMLGYAITAARRFREQLPLLAAALAVTCLCALWLVPSGGLEGAAASVGAGAAALAIGEAFLLRGALRARRTAA